MHAMTGVTLFGVTAATGGAHVTKLQTKPISAIALYTRAGGDIIAIDGSGNQTAVTGSSPASCTGLGCALFQPDDAMLLPACGSSPERLVVHDGRAGLSPDKSIKAMDLTSGAISVLAVTARSASTVSLNAVGCATVLDINLGSSSVQPVVAIDDTALLQPAQSRAEVGCDASKCVSLELPIAEAGVGFATGAEPFLILSTIDATGVELQSGVIESDGSKGHLVSFARLPSVAVPHQITIGQLDDDALPDLVWSNAFKRGDVLEVAYGQTVDGAPLAALSTPTIAIDQMIVGDVTGDGHDDVTLSGAGFVVVIPTGLQADNGKVPSDTPTCP
jgi:hypothetical protein